MIFPTLAFLTALIITAFAIPSIIRLAQVRDWLDRPSERKSHTVQTPLLGGVGIFGGLVLALVLWMPEAEYLETRYVFAAMTILFMVGIKDDLYPIPAGKKLLGQLVTAGLLVFGTGAVIPSFFGIFGWYELSWWFSRLFSVLTMLVIINGFNLIDGINGLAGSMGLLCALFFGSFFFSAGEYFYSVIGWALAGALLAFLYYNFSNRIFMGDTGALVIGMVIGLLTTHFLRIHHFESGVYHPRGFMFEAVPAVAVGLLILPLFDTLRVFVLRIWKGRSPLSPDRLHLHHMLIDLGMSHGQATLLLICANLSFLLVAILLQDLNTLLLVILIFVSASVASGLLNYAVIRKRRRLEERMV
ncbi:MAG: glycosyltransferase family 4 protein [Saprospiraceae bacterium]